MEALSLSPAMEEATTKISGLWIDPLTKVIHHQKKSDAATVGEAVSSLTRNVIKKVNDAYAFDPPLCPEDMIIDRYSGKLNLLFHSF
jgi:hypothetical protein